MTVLFDVSTLLAHARPDHPAHADAAAALHAVLGAGTRFHVPDVVALAVVRIATRTRAFAEPSSTPSAFAYLAALRAQPTYAPLVATTATFTSQERLMVHAGPGPNEVVDTYLAALAIEHGAVVVSLDRGFARFPGVAWVDPADPAARATLER